MEKMSTLSIDIKEKLYQNETCAIKGLTFSVDKGEFVAIVGPSGSGKTTLLNIIAGIDKHYSGQIMIAEAGKAQVHHQHPDLGFMFQDARLLPWLTVGENIQLVMGNVDTTKQSRMLNLLQQVNLKSVIDQYPGQLSGGMKRRVSMVRAFINQPQILLMDEPFQSLDEPTANGLRTMLFELWEQTLPTVLFVTHSLREALAVADRILFLSDKPARVLLDYTVEASRPRQLEDEAVTTMHTQLLTEHPSILSGLL